jgi:hypothetical protein
LPINDSALGYQGSLDANNLPTGGTTENYYVDFDRSITTGGVTAVHRGTGKVSATPFYTGQSVSYTVIWIVQDDNVTPAMTGLRRITVRAEASRSAMEGNGIDLSLLTKEAAQISTVRTPPQ